VTPRGKSGGPRQLKIRLRSGKTRSQSSKLWLERQLNDARRVGAPEQGRVVAIDILPMDPIPGVSFAAVDFLDVSAPAALKNMIDGPADVVLSDMAANATGHAKTDHLKIMALVEAAAEFAQEVLAPGGTFLAKVLQGGTEAELLVSLKRDYKIVKHVKPVASRAGSAELYLLAIGFRGQNVQGA
jgi:23S rRNA (uridine2552-2'-O)-methyltransferase